MRTFEILIPAAPDGFDITLRVSAETWSKALTTGLQKLEGIKVEHVHVEMLDEQTMVVTETASQRQFRVTEVPSATNATAQTMPAPAAAPPVAPVHVPPQAPPPAPPPAPPKAAAPVPSRALPVASQVVAPAVVAPQKRTVSPTDEATVETLQWVFERAADVYSVAKDDRQAADFFIDLAMQAVPAESGAVFFSDITHDDLYFAAARGPKAHEVMGHRVAMGVGIVGVAALYGVSIAVSDARVDPRFDPTLAQKVGYPAGSMVCAPVQKEGRLFGAIELLNRKQGKAFSSAEVEAVEYLSKRMADFLDQYYMAKA